jgi:hypothetical protein
VAKEEFEPYVAVPTAVAILRVRERFLPAVRPVCGIRHYGGRDDQGTVHLLGNVVLFTARGRHFGLTAAHVVDEFDPDGLRILGEPDMLDLSATRVHRTIAPDDDRGADKSTLASLSCRRIKLRPSEPSGS